MPDVSCTGTKYLSYIITTNNNKARTRLIKVLD